jgi:hypothetical protein
MNRSKYQTKIELAHRLRAVGVPLEIPVDDGESRLLMRQFGEGPESCAFHTRYGGTGYAVYVRLTFVHPGAISSIDLELPWSDPSISLLEDPNETGDPHGEYCFSGESAYRFHRSLVINHYSNVRHMRSRGTTLEGFLLWAGMNPIPEDWPLHKKIPAFVIVCDQFGRSDRCAVILYDTRDKKSLPRERRKSTRKPLFECPDPKPEPASSNRSRSKIELETEHTR